MEEMMIHNALRQIDHSIIGMIGRSVRDVYSNMSITDVGIVGIAYYIFHIPLVYMFNNVFCYSFAVGFCKSSFAGDVAARVNTVWRAQQTFTRKIVLIVLGSYLMIHFQPVSLQISVIYLGLQLGAKLYTSSHSRMQQIEPPPQQHQGEIPV